MRATPRSAVTLSQHSAGMISAMDDRNAVRYEAPTMISVSTRAPGVVLAVHGPLDEHGCDLLAEVVRAALLTVKRANRIHLDLREVWPSPPTPPRIVRRLVRAGARVTGPARAAMPSADVAEAPGTPTRGAR